MSLPLLENIVFKMGFTIIVFIVIIIVIVIKYNINYDLTLLPATAAAVGLLPVSVARWHLHLCTLFPSALSCELTAAARCRTRYPLNSTRHELNSRLAPEVPITRAFATTTVPRSLHIASVRFYARHSTGTGQRSVNTRSKVQSTLGQLRSVSSRSNFPPKLSIDFPTNHIGIETGRGLDAVGLPRSLGNA